MRQSAAVPGKLTMVKQKEQEFFAIAKRFRNDDDPETVKRLGEQLGRMVFGA